MEKQIQQLERNLERREQEFQSSLEQLKLNSKLERVRMEAIHSQVRVLLFCLHPYELHRQP